MLELKPIIPPPPQRRDMDLHANRLPSTFILDGQSLELIAEGREALSAVFENGQVRFSGTNPDGAGFEGIEPYDAVEMRPGIFFLDWTSAETRRCFTHVVDFNRGRALALWIIINQPGPDATMTEFIGSLQIVGSDAAYTPIEQTREVLGKRLVCKYSDEAALEHIYANSGVVVWQWMLSPPEMGLQQEVGTESATFWKIEENLYLLSSRGDPPIGLILFLDLNRKRNVGRLFGYSPFGLIDHRCGAKITMLGEFQYPEEFQPG